jgi:hypothetical protein
MLLNYPAIKDETDELSSKDLDDLKDFLVNHLLSTNLELEWLDSVTIRKCGRSSECFGFWTAKLRYSRESADQVDGIVAKIVLNRSLLPTLDDLKETLAHEYGHHWTLCYLAVHQGINPFEKSLPASYYELRGLDPEIYTYDYQLGWDRCDKEVIAEDYRILFAPLPYNTDHNIMSFDSELALPTAAIQNYIEDLQNPL